MTKGWKRTRKLAASRTGIAKLADFDLPKSSESRIVNWIYVVFVIIAFAMALQLDSENKSGRSRVVVVDRF